MTARDAHRRLWSGRQAIHQDQLEEIECSTERRGASDVDTRRGGRASGRATSAARAAELAALVDDAYADNRSTGAFVVIDAATTTPSGRLLAF